MEDKEKFQQQWESSRIHTGIDSNCNGSKSNSRGQPIPKKHKLVCSLVPPKNPCADGQIEFEKKKKNRIRRNACEPAVLDDVKIFVESLLDDLRVSQKNMLTWMREEMQKLAADDITPRPRREGSNRRIRKSIHMQLENKVEDYMLLDQESLKGNVHGWQKHNSKLNIQPNFHENVLVDDHQNSFTGTLCQENIMWQKHKFEENSQTQHLGNFEKNTKLEDRQINFTGTIQVQHQETLEENLQVSIPMQHQNNSEENNQKQDQDSFKTCTKTENFHSGSFEGSVKSNIACCQALEEPVGYAHDQGSRASSMKENKGKKFVFSEEQNSQSGVPIQNIQLQHPKSLMLGTRTRNGNDRFLEINVNHRIADSKSCFNVLDNQVDYGLSVASIASITNDKGEKLGVFGEPYVSSNSFCQADSSMYLTLPTVISKTCIENLRLSTCDDFFSTKSSC